MPFRSLPPPATAVARTPDLDEADAVLAQRGDERAFERLYVRHAPRLHALATRFVGRDLADDALQDIFVQAWRRLDQFRGEARFGSWLHRVGINILLRQSEIVRRLERRLADGLGGDDALPARGAGPEARLDLDAALQRLAPEVRAVVVLHDVEGFAHDEIGDALGISVSASKMRLHRGRFQLREWLLA